MYFMVMLIVDDLNLCPSVLDAWDATGVGGITILESTGLAKVRGANIRDDLPLMPSFAKLMQGREGRHRTLLTVVEGEEWVDRLVEATESILGDLNQPKNGVMFVLPVARALGVQGGQARARGES